MKSDLLPRQRIFELEEYLMLQTASSEPAWVISHILSTPV